MALPSTPPTPDMYISVTVPEGSESHSPKVALDTGELKSPQPAFLWETWRCTIKVPVNPPLEFNITAVPEAFDLRINMPPILFNGPLGTKIELTILKLPDWTLTPLELLIINVEKSTIVAELFVIFCAAAPLNLIVLETKLPVALTTKSPLILKSPVWRVFKVPSIIKSLTFVVVVAVTVWPKDIVTSSLTPGIQLQFHVLAVFQPPVFTETIPALAPEAKV